MDNYKGFVTYSNFSCNKAGYPALLFCQSSKLDTNEHSGGSFLVENVYLARQRWLGITVKSVAVQQIYNHFCDISR